jgi:hypothetical protein
MAFEPDRERVGMDLSSNNVTIIMTVVISNKLPWRLRSGARNQLSDRGNCDI